MLLKLDVGALQGSTDPIQEFGPKSWEKELIRIIFARGLLMIEISETTIVSLAGPSPETDVDKI